MVTMDCLTTNVRYIYKYTNPLYIPYHIILLVLSRESSGMIHNNYE